MSSSSVPPPYYTNSERISNGQCSDVKAIPPTTRSTGRVQPPCGTISRSGKTNYSELAVSWIPEVLGRPDLPEITMDMIAAIDSSFDGLTVSQVKVVLQERLQGMIQGRACTAMHPVHNPDQFPAHLPATILSAADPSSSTEAILYPTHVIPVHAYSTEGRMTFDLYTIHSLVLAAHCARLPPFPPPTKEAPLETETGGQLLLPVISLHIPDPASFALILGYLYCKDLESLVNDLCPLSQSLFPAFFDPDVNERVWRGKLEWTADAVRVVYTTADIRRMMAHVEGVWLNMCELGINDEGLWSGMHVGWYILRKALGMRIKMRVDRHL